VTAPSCDQALQGARVLGLDRLDAQLLLLHALHRPQSDRAWLVAHGSDLISDACAETYRSLTLRRAAGEPLAYIVGFKEFFGLRFRVDARVLVPRPDTETLVHWTLEQLLSQPDPGVLRLLDMGTGSGAIALAVAHALKKSGRAANIVALDASRQALDVARQNAGDLGLDAAFCESDWFSAVTGGFHVIASNPPYIADSDPHLPALVHEPLRALAAGSDGLQDIRRIICQAPDHLQTDGWLLLEHGFDQEERVAQLLRQRGFAEIQNRPDLAGIIRCTGGRWPG
jgi:release factor glutamine methyltransferase